ncbi:MAG: MerR family transcriptional regulator [Thermoanaerobaculia bacterium]
MTSKSKLFVKIGEACKELDIQPYVLRYWETEFPPLSPDKSKSGQRVYSEEDLAIIRRIKELLYEEGFTIAGAKKKLEGELASGGPKTRAAGAAAPAREKEPQTAAPPEPAPEPEPAEVAEPAAAEPAQPKAKPKKTSKSKSKSAAAKTASPGEATHLRQALEGALEEARAILSLLGD